MHVAISKMANVSIARRSNLRLIVLAAVVLCFVKLQQKRAVYTELPGYLVSFSQSVRNHSGVAR